MIPCCVRESLDFSTRDIVETPTPDGPNTITKDCRPQATTVPGPTRDTIVRSSAESLAVRADRYHYVLSATAHPSAVPKPAPIRSENVSTMKKARGSGASADPKPSTSHMVPATTSTAPQPLSARAAISAACLWINLAWQNAATPLANTRTAIGTACVHRKGVRASRSRWIQCMDGPRVRGGGVLICSLGHVR